MSYRRFKLTALWASARRAFSIAWCPDGRFAPICSRDWSGNLHVFSIGPLHPALCILPGHPLLPTPVSPSFSLCFLPCCYYSGKGRGCIYRQDDGLFIAAVFYFMGDSWLISQGTSLFQVINLFPHRVFDLTLHNNFYLPVVRGKGKVISRTEFTPFLHVVSSARSP